MSKLGDEIYIEQQNSFDSLKQKRSLWDRSEKLFHGILVDLASEETNSKVFDPKLTTLAIERSYRVMAQMAVGKVKGIGQNDLADAKIKNLLLENYVIPNANAQFSLLTKFRMADMYSSIYGNFFVLIDQDVKKNGYIGPDMWLLNIRDIFPQVGAISLDDSDQIIIRTWRPLSYFKNLKEKDGFKNLDKIISLLEKKPGSKQARDSSNNSKRQEDQYPKTTPSVGSGYYEVLTRFERDRWVDICVDADKIDFRDQKNSHENGELPVECKYSIPLIDDFMGTSDFEMGAPMQNLVNSNWNWYGDAVQMSIFPPVLINKGNVASPSSLKPIPAAQWLGRNDINNFARPLELNPQGIQTFQSTHQIASASLLNLFGTTDTAVTAQTDPGFGRTPNAINFQAQRESTKDNADKFYMEQFVSRVMKKFVNLISKKQQKSISFRMFPDEIEKISREYPEIKDIYDENTGKVTVNKSKKNYLYDYEIVSGSTYAIDQKSQQDNLTQILSLWMQSQTPQGNLLQEQLKNEGYTLKFGELFKRIVANSSIQDWDKILEEMTEKEKAESVVNKADEAFQLAMQGGGIGQIPTMPQESQTQDMGMSQTG